MNAPENHKLSEDDLDVLVSIAIQRAELLSEQHLANAREAWREVMEYEIRLVDLTDAGDVPGGVARVGAIAAALAAGHRYDAMSLRKKYLDDDSLPMERRKAIDRVFAEDQEIRKKLYPSLTRRGGRLEDLAEWRRAGAAQPRVFPCFA